MLMTIISYLTIYIVWGSTYYFIKTAIATIPPFYVVGLRFAIGGTFLLTYALISNRLRNKPRIREVISSIFIGCLLLIGGNGLVTLAEKRVDSYMAALIVSCIPIAVLLMDRIISKTRISRSSIIGIILGMSGVGILLFKANTSFSISGHLWLIFAAVVFWSLGTSLSKIFPLPKDIFVNSGIQLTTVGIICLTVLQNSTPFSTINWGNITVYSWFSLGYLTILGSFALACYSYLLKHEPNHRIVTYTFVNPLIAILFGIYIGGEKAVPGLIPGTSLILLGLALMFYGKKVADWLR